MQYILLGFLLACLMLGVAAICLGVRYLQVSQQLQHMTRVLEATDSSLQQQLHEKTQQLQEKTRQLGLKEEDLRRSAEELALKQESLREKQSALGASEQRLQVCQSEEAKAKESLRGEQDRRTDLQQRLTAMRDTLKRYFSCRSSDTCCPLGWMLHQKRCFHISLTKRNWEESQMYCTSLSSKLAEPSIFPLYSYRSPSQENWPRSLRESLFSGSDFWIGQAESSKQSQENSCLRINRWGWKQTTCLDYYPCICEVTAFTFPDGDYSLP